MITESDKKLGADILNNYVVCFTNRPRLAMTTSIKVVTTALSQVINSKLQYVQDPSGLQS